MALSLGSWRSFWLQLEVSGPFWLQVECLGIHLGSKLEVLEAIWAPSWGVLGPSWLQVGGSWGHSGSKLGGLGSKLKSFGGILAPSWVSSWLAHAILLTWQKP